MGGDVNPLEQLALRLRDASRRPQTEVAFRQVPVSDARVTRVSSLDSRGRPRPVVRTSTVRQEKVRRAKINNSVEQFKRETLAKAKDALT